MRKKRFVLFAVVILLAFSLTALLAACDDFDYGVDTLTFDVNGATYKVVPVKDLNGEIPVEDPIPNDDNYEFVGWFWDLELKERVKNSELYKGELPHFIAYAGFEDPYGRLTKSMDAKNLDKSGGSGGTGGSETGGNGDTGGSSGADASFFEFELIGSSYSVKGPSNNFTGTAINIPSTYNGKPVTAISNRAFEDELEHNNYDSVTIPNSITKIGDEAFKNCWKLTTVNIPNSVEHIGMHAFDNCTSLKSVTLPNNSKFTKIPERLFLNCKNLTSVTIPDNVTEIDVHAFENCEELATIKIPTGMTVITVSSFYGAYFEEVIIPTSITRIEMNAFSNAFYDPSTAAIYYKGTESQWDAIAKEEPTRLPSTIYYNSTR